MSNSATLREVAKLAGVSLGTASLALNNRPNVLPETRARVVDAARVLGYHGRDGEAAPQPVDVAVIGMLTKHDSGLPVEINPFFSHVQLGVESECRQRNISLMYANVEVDQSNHPVIWPRMVSDRNIDGLIVVGAYIEELVGGLKRRLDRPIVLVDSYAPSFSFDRVLIDNFAGTQGAIEHLIDRGHRHIGLVGVNSDSPPDILERREGYLAALRAHGITHSYIEEGPLHRERGYTAAQRLLGRAPQLTAIFACNDDTAMGVMNAAHDMGLSVPDDLSIVGFDDIDLAKEVRPALTTVHVPKTWLGRLGVRHLIERAQHPGQPQLTVTVATHLVERESVAAPRPTGPQGGE
jgi:LacI family transcriptional regulator